MPPRHHVAERERFAQALAAGKKPEEAARIAGYRDGTAFAANARKRAMRADVKARVAELQAPHLEQANKAMAIDIHWWIKQHVDIVKERGLREQTTNADAQRSLEQLAKHNGWYAPERREIDGVIGIATIERRIIEPAKAGPETDDRHGGDIPPASEAGEI